VNESTVALIADLRTQLSQANQSLTLALQRIEELTSRIVPPAAPPNSPPRVPPAAPWTFAQSATFDIPVNASNGRIAGPSTGAIESSVQRLFNASSNTSVITVLRQSSLYSVFAPDGSDPSVVQNELRLILCSNRSTCEVTLASNQRRRLSTQLTFSVLLGLLPFELLDATPSVSEGQLAQRLGLNNVSQVFIPSPTLSGLSARVTIDRTEAINWQCDDGVAGAIADVFDLNCSLVTILEGPDSIFPPFLPPILPPSPLPPPPSPVPPYPNFPPSWPPPSFPPRPQLPAPLAPQPGIIDPTEQPLLAGGGEGAWSGVSIALLVLCILLLLCCVWVWCVLTVKSLYLRRKSRRGPVPEVKNADDAQETPCETQPEKNLPEISGAVLTDERSERVSNEASRPVTDHEWTPQTDLVPALRILSDKELLPQLPKKFSTRNELRLLHAIHPEQAEHSPAPSARTLAEELHPHEQISPMVYRV